MGSHRWKAVSAIVVGVLMSPAITAAEMWKCTQADGTVLFSDGGGAGCREVNVLPELQSARTPIVRNSIEVPQKIEHAPPVLPKKTGQPLSSYPFIPTTRMIPSLSYHDLPAGMRAQGWSMPNKGDITMVQLQIAHLPAGNGPQISTDEHFKGEARSALGTAVLAAAKATRYDPRFLQVRMTMPIGSIFLAGLRVDGPSAGVAWTVAVTSALLGDALRPDVCLSGTMDMQLRVGWVGGLEHKIEGCHILPNFREMLLPAGQNTFAITDKGMARSIRVREVATLAEAYEITTGQPLRSAP
jgi:Lon protease (S16) C-terminal proteolytic domain